MYTFETQAALGRDAQRVTTAYYRYIELHSREAAAGPAIDVNVEGDREVLRMGLWSEDAVRDFQRFVANFTLEPPRGLPPTRSFGL